MPSLLSCKWAIPIILLLWILYAPLGFAQRALEPYKLSPRVGTEIDSAERAYFGLFPRVPDFLSATLYRVNPETFVVVISHWDTQPTTELEVKAEAVRELGRYVESFEALAHDTRSVRWGLIHSLAETRNPLRMGAELLVHRWNGMEERGRLLHADERAIVLAPEDFDPSRRPAPGELVVVRPAEIAYVLDRRPLPRRLFGELSIPVPGAADVYREYALPRLKRHAAFTSVPSPTLETFLADQVERAGASELAADQVAAAQAAYVGRVTNKFHVAVSTHALGISSGAGRFTVATPADESSQPVHVTHPLMSMRAEYSVARWLRLGVVANYTRYAAPFSAFEEVRTVGDERDATRLASSLRGAGGQIRVSGAFASLTTVHVAKPFDYLSLAWGASKLGILEFRLSAGPALGRLFVDSQLKYADKSGLSVYVYGDAYNDHQTVAGAFGALDGDLYLSRFLSVGLGVQGWFFPQMRVREHELRSRDSGDAVVKTIRAFNAPVRATALTLGLRLHV